MNKYRIGTDVPFQLSVDDGVEYLDLSNCTILNVAMYCDAQEAFAGACTWQLNADDHTRLDCVYPGDMQVYTGIMRAVVVMVGADGGKKAYDLADIFEIVATTEEANATEDTVTSAVLSAWQLPMSTLSTIVEAAINATEGATESAIAEISYTESAEDDGINVLHIEQADGTAHNFNFKNGSKGSQGIQGPRGEQGPQGEQGNTGSSVDYPFELVNNETTDDPTKAHTAAGAKRLQDEIDVLNQEVRGYGWTEGKYLTSTGGEVADAAWGITDFIPYEQGNDVIWKWGNAETVAGGRTINFYKADKTYIPNGYWSASGATGQKTITAANIASDAGQAAYIRASFKIDEGASVTVGTTVAWVQGGGLVQEVEKNTEDIAATNNTVEALNAPILEELSPTIAGGKLLGQDGTLAWGSSAWGVSDLEPVKQGEIYTIKATQYPDSPYVGVQLLNAGKIVTTNYIVGVNLVSDQDKTIEIQEDGFLRVGVRVSDGYTHYIKQHIPARKVLERSNTRIIPKNVCFVGMSIWWYDSRTLANGFMGNVTAVGYQSWLRRLFTFKSDSGTSLCVNGGSLGALNETDAYSIMYQSSNWATMPDAIWTLDTITNDFKRDIPIGTLSDYENNTGILTYYGALRAFKDKVVALSGTDAIVICANALHRNNAGYTSTSENGNGDTLADFELALCKVAALNGWRFVDQFRFSSVQDENLQATTIDGLHLNNYGYSLAVKPWIEEFNLISVS